LITASATQGEKKQLQAAFYSTVTRGAQLSSSSNQRRATSSSSALPCLHCSREQWRNGSAEEEEEGE